MNAGLIQIKLTIGMHVSAERIKSWPTKERPRERPDLAQCTKGLFRCQRIPGAVRGDHPLKEADSSILSSILSTRAISRST
jgi:hypothetical protein